MRAWFDASVRLLARAVAMWSGLPASGARLLAVALSVLAAVTLAACSGSPKAPELLTVVDVAPRLVDTGDRLDVAMTGLTTPDAREASVELVGELRRPGQPQKGRESVRVATAQVSLDRVTFAVTEALVARACGRGDEAEHTTFVGDVIVTVHPSGAGKLPIAGTLRGVTLELVPPSPRRRVLERAREDADKALAHLGLTIDDEHGSAGRGLDVRDVRPGSPAAAAGIAAGDRLLSVGGVTALSRLDVRPAPGLDAVTLVIARGDAAPVSHVLSIEGLSPNGPIDLAVSLALLVPLALYLALRASPAASLLAFVEVKLGARFERRERRPRGRVDRFVGALGELVAWPLHTVRALSREMGTAGRPASEGGLLALAPWLVFASVSAMFAALPFGQRVVASDLDASVLFVPATALLAVMALVTGGLGARRLYLAPLGALRSVAGALAWQLPALGALVFAVARAGSLRLADLVSAQAGAGGARWYEAGSYPWRWLAFDSPVSLGLFLLAVLALVAEHRFEAGRAPGDLSEADRKRPGRTVLLRHTLALFADWSNVFVVAGLLVSLYLGGWGLPGVTPEQAASPAVATAGMALFVLKCWALIMLVVALRWAVRVRASLLRGVYLRAIAPASAALLVVGVLAEEALAIPPVVRTSLTAVTLGTAALVLAHGLARARAVAHARAHVGLNPFL
jgi:NADH-quinone oxidoreductase subunit H